MKIIRTSNSEIKTGKRCLMQHSFKFRQGLRPVRAKPNLFLGTWLHKGLEEYYRAGSWKDTLKELSKLTEPMFDEEKEFYRDPLEMTNLLLSSYKWHYREQDFIPLLTEETFECTLGTLRGVRVNLRGRIDIYAQWYGHPWVIDHKSTKSRLPMSREISQSMDFQLSLYPYVLQKCYDKPVSGTVYNYIRAKVPSKPKLNKDGSLSKRKVDTTPYVLAMSLKELGFDPKDFKRQILDLKLTQTFFDRVRVPRDPISTQKVVDDVIHWAVWLHTYKNPTRTVNFLCDSNCDYSSLCLADFHGHDARDLLGDFEVIDPFDYLEDSK